MAEDEITALKVALCNQFLLIKRLYTELEEEREASASGADEALSMILRLQREKAEEKMEHCQYRKMAEAKMQHAEESLAMLEQVLFQKEFENSSLKYQVQAYTRKLLSIGVGNTDLNDKAILGNRIFLKSSTSLERTSYRGNARRPVSMPSIQLNMLLYEMDFFSGDGSLIPSLQSIRSEVGVYENHFEEKQRQQFSREAVIKECNSDSKQDQEVDGSVNKEQQTQNFKHTAGSKCLPLNKESHKSLTIDPQSYQEWTPDHESNYQSNLVEPTTLATSVETDIQRLNHRIQQVEADIYVMKQEDVKKGKRELKLLREVHEQLGTVQSHITNLLSHKYSPHDVAIFDSLTEAMLSFSI